MTGDTPATEASARLCVLASSSSGNCSVLEIRPPNAPARSILLDAGLSPRRTAAELVALGIEPASVESIVLTHLDHDHCNNGWSMRSAAKYFREDLSICMHRRHAGRAERTGLLFGRTQVFDTTFTAAGLTIRPILQSHDALGVVAFRIDLPAAADTPPRALGYATDLGHATPKLIDHLRGVQVLAIESNYCPDLQRRSGRPAFLQQRIMGGSGHLSNQQCAEAVELIGPTEHVVLLHLSRQCNRPDLAAESHSGRPYRLTTSLPDRPTAWIDLVWPGAPAPARRFVEVEPRPRARQTLLFPA